MSSANREASARTRWLAEVGEALGEAQRLTGQLAQWRSGKPEALLLRIRIMAVLIEVEALHHGRSGPEWSNGAALWPDQIIPTLTPPAEGHRPLRTIQGTARSVAPPSPPSRRNRD
jgi:hypothetical protein